MTAAAAAAVRAAAVSGAAAEGGVCGVVRKAAVNGLTVCDVMHGDVFGPPKGLQGLISHPSKKLYTILSLLVSASTCHRNCALQSPLITCLMPCRDLVHILMLCSLLALCACAMMHISSSQCACATLHNLWVVGRSRDIALCCELRWTCATSQKCHLLRNCRCCTRGAARFAKQLVSELVAVKPSCACWTFFLYQTRVVACLFGCDGEPPKQKEALPTLPTTSLQSIAKIPWPA